MVDKDLSSKIVKYLRNSFKVFTSGFGHNMYTISFVSTLVVDFGQRLGAMHSKRWSNYAFSMFI